MLLSTTPSRPRPPAMARRSITRNGAELDKPPPYAEPGAFSSGLFGGGMTPLEKAAHQSMMSSVEVGNEPASPTAVNTALNGRSREELEQMLLTAHNIIRKHEGDLTRASEETRDLRDQNRFVMSQLEKLSSRLPQSPVSTSISMRNDSLSFGSNDDDLTMSPPLSPRRRTFQTPIRAPHMRGVSVASPVALAQLADQNAELVARLDQLQEETNMLDHAGKRKLRKLEHEIGLIKEELEQVQKRNMQLEKEVEEKEALEKQNEEEHERRKLEREEKARAIRESLKRADSELGELPNFAPSSSCTSSFASPARRSRESTSKGTVVDDDILYEPDLSMILESSFSTNPSRISTLGAGAFPPPGEAAIVIQLLAKIEELEKANKDFIRQQAETKAKIESATEEVNNMKQAYQDAEDEMAQAEMDGEYIKEEAEEWVDEAGGGTTALGVEFGPGLDRSIRSVDVMFTSTVRSSSRHTRRASSKSSLHSLRGSVSRRAVGNQRMMTSKRARKPLTNNMFLSPATSISERGSPAHLGSSGSTPSHFLEPPSQVLLSTRRGRETFQKLPAVDFSANADVNDRETSLISRVGSHASRPGASSVRSVPSFGDMADYMSALGLGSPAPALKSLESELEEEKAEYSAHWPESHSAEFSRHMFGTSPTKSDAGSCISDASFNSTFTSAHFTNDDEDSMAVVNPAITALYSALDPMLKGKPLEEDEHILPVGCLRSSPVETFYGLNQAVAARPTRWMEIPANTAQPRITVAQPSPTQPPTSTSMGSTFSTPPAPYTSEGRPDPWDTTTYLSDQEDRSEGEETAFSPGGVKGKGRADEEESEYGSPTRPPFNKRDTALIQLNQAFLTRRRSIMSQASSAEDEDDGFEDAVDHLDPQNALDDGKRYDPKVLARRLQNSYLETFFEVWLILQFIMVLAIFVYSSVRQGPRAVMLGQKQPRSMVKRKAA
ncbi:hypothetical protein FRB94_001215 [Tulasnella sp. JGI-2019a]|nr:hypothetical protein FRB94_001215 [Tulasnella sp. JGI-2019a]